MREIILESYLKGHCVNAYELFGAHMCEEDGVQGVRFTVWAPHAKNVQVIGQFNEWDGTERH